MKTHTILNNSTLKCTAIALLFTVLMIFSFQQSMTEASAADEATFTFTLHCGTGHEAFAEKLQESLTAIELY